MAPDGDFFKRLLDNLGTGVYFVDRERHITYWNRGAEAISGHRAANVMGRRCGDGILNHVDATGRLLCGDACPLAGTMEDGRPREVEVLLRHEDGHRVPVRVKADVIRDDAGTIVGAVEVFDEARERQVDRERIEELERLALLDPVTQLGNRRFAEMQLTSKLGELDRFGREFGVLFFDIDRFKAANDKYGHEVGDRLLRMVSRTARVSIRPFDQICRWGGDEFVGLIAHVDRSRLGVVAEKIRALVEASRLDVNGDALHVTISLGASVARAADTPETLLARADRLMYASKAGGGNRVTLPPGGE